MNALQLLENMREIKEACEETLNAAVHLSLYVDRLRKEGLILEVQHKFGRYDDDGSVFHLLLGQEDDLENISKLKEDVVSWIILQSQTYAEVYGNIKREKS